MITFGSLFAGIGGLDLGLERAGMVCKWQVEIDDYCQKVLAKHWPEIKRYGDIRTVGRQNLEPVELICGGFPCQPHSIAGKRRGAEDDRNLWPEFMRVVRETRPRYVLAENVPGIVTTYLDTVLSDLESEGYSCWTFNIPACSVDAPHRRERIFIIAHSLRLGLSAGTFEQTLQPKKQETARQNTPEFCEVVSEDGDVADGAINGLEKRWSSSRVRSERFAKNGWWTVEPNVGRVADGVPARVDRLRALGNAVVPQVAEWIGNRIIEYDALHK